MDPVARVLLDMGVHYSHLGVWHGMVWHAMACYGLAPTILRPLLARLSTMATLGRRAGQCSEDKRGKISQGDEGTRSGNFLEEEEGVEGVEGVEEEEEEGEEK